MKTLLFFLSLAAAPMSYADFLPQSIPPRAPPIIQCENDGTRIPESKMTLQIYPDTPLTLHPYMEIQQIDLNQPPLILFSGEVTRSVDKKGAMIFFTPDIKLSLEAEQNGHVKGQLEIRSETPLALSCQILYHIQN